jgi:hypothetical protein
MNMKNTCISLILVSLFRLFLIAQPLPIDFRYAPTYSFSAICLPDDWQKTVLMNTGSLAYDFGPGPYASPRTEITIRLKDQDLLLTGQTIANPRIPIATSQFSGGKTVVTQLTFACVPEASLPIRSTYMTGKTEIERVGGLTGCLGWTAPPDSADPAFRNVAWGTNRPIKYRVRVLPKSKHVVALGLCESYKPRPGGRVLDLRVEGAPTQTVDALIDGQKNIPHVYTFNGQDADGDGWLAIESHASVSCPDPNTTLNVLWVFPNGTPLHTGDLIAGRLNQKAEVYWDCGRETGLQGPAARQDVIEAHLSGENATPIIHIRTGRRLQPDSQNRRLTWDRRPFVSTLPAPRVIRQTDDGWDIEFPHATRDLAVIITNGVGRARQIRSLTAVNEQRSRAGQYWKGLHLPFDRFVLPDTTLQNLFDASIRNLYQIREQIDGTPTFIPGPSVYRGPWMHDAVWHTAAATMLGDTNEARKAIEGLLQYQEPDGRIRMMAPLPMNRETPLLIHAMWRYSRLTGNSHWLEQHWSAFSHGIEWLWKLRQSTLADPRSPGYGLFPPGFSDGGLAGLHPEYGSSYWALIGLKSAIDAARWLKKDAEATRWSVYFRELTGSFRTSAARDMRKDRYGNIYLPMKVGDTSSTTPPQQANWGIIEAQAYVRLFDAHDSLLTGSLAMLQAEVKEGLAVNTGWVKDGLWPFFSMIQGIAHLAQREYPQAGDLLTATANHASTTGTWIEEQLPRGGGTRTGGDASNASASALFIQLIRCMMIYERDSTVDLLAGVPEQWYVPGSSIELKSVPTMFGPCTLRLRLSPSGRDVEVRVTAMGNKGATGGPTLFLEVLKKMGYRFPDGSAAPLTLQGRWGEEMIVRLVREG